MFKTAVSLEETGKTAVVVLDKTGTITEGEPTVTQLYPAKGVSETELLSYAYVLEKKSEHPLARAILRYGEEKEEEINTFLMTDKSFETCEVTQFCAVSGNGLSAKLGNQEIFGGNYHFISSKVMISEEISVLYDELSDQGKTPLFFAKDGTYIGMIAVEDVMKKDSPKAIRELRNMGIYVVMLTGDNEKTARAVGQQAGVDEVVAGVLPEGKEKVVQELKKTGKVAMVGDGINDAPALTSADMGIAIGAGTDIAIDAADVVLMKSRLSDVPAAIRLSRAALRNLHENLFWAFFYNLIGIPLAAGIWYPLFGWKLNPMFAAAAMSLSSFCVVTNALRLNWFRLYDSGNDHKRKTVKSATAVSLINHHEQTIKQIKEEKTMEKTMKIEGMMCGHCEARVKKTLEAISGVEEALVSHEAGTAVVKMSDEVSDEILKKAVEAQDYPVVEIY